jgi:hypothetical protein
MKIDIFPSKNETVAFAQSTKPEIVPTVGATKLSVPALAMVIGDPDVPALNPLLKPMQIAPSMVKV